MDCTDPAEIQVHPKSSEIGAGTIPLLGVSGPNFRHAPVKGLSALGLIPVSLLPHWNIAVQKPFKIPFYEGLGLNDFLL